MIFSETNYLRIYWTEFHDFSPNGSYLAADCTEMIGDQPAEIKIVIL